MVRSASTGRRRTARWAGAVGLLAAGAITGGVLSTALSASASNTPTSSSTSFLDSGHARPPRPGGAQPVRPDEKSLPSATAAKLRAAALKAVPGGTVYRIETDAGDGVYEAHMRTASGSLVTVKFAKNLQVTKVERGMGAGDPPPAGGGTGTSA